MVFTKGTSSIAFKVLLILILFVQLYVLAEEDLGDLGFGGSEDNPDFDGTLPQYTLSNYQQWRSPSQSNYNDARGDMRYHLIRIAGAKNANDREAFLIDESDDSATITQKNKDLYPKYAAVAQAQVDALRKRIRERHEGKLPPIVGKFVGDDTKPKFVIRRSNGKELQVESNAKEWDYYRQLRAIQVAHEKQLNPLEKAIAVGLITVTVRDQGVALPEFELSIPPNAIHYNHPAYTDIFNAFVELTKKKYSYGSVLAEP